MKREPYHYTGIIKELAEAQHAVLLAADWHEGVALARLSQSLTEEDCERAEWQCLQAAASRLRGAFQAITERLETMRTAVLLREGPIHETQERLERLAESVPDDHLPPELRRG